ncbi:pectate lyase-like adhesive domain-containing protein [Enterococcus sp. LJL90]
MKNRKKHWLLLINFIAVFSLIAVTIVQLSSGAMEIFAAPKELSLSTEEALTQLKAGDEFVVTISDSRDESDIATTENTEVPFVNKSGDITDAENAANSASVSRQWRMTLPEGITFDETAEKATLTAATASGITPVFHFDQETRILDITVNASITKLALSLTAETAGEYELSVADKNIMLTDSEKLAVVVGEAEEGKAGVKPLAVDEQLIVTRSDANELTAYNLFNLQINDLRGLTETFTWEIKLPSGLTFNENFQSSVSRTNITSVAYTYDSIANQLSITVTPTTSGEVVLGLNLMATAAGTFALSVIDAINDQQSADLNVTVNAVSASTAIVTNWDEFVTALGNRSITQISLANNLAAENTTNVSGVFSNQAAGVGSSDTIPSNLRGYDPTVYEYFYVQQDSSRNLVIEGLGNTFNFGNIAIGFLDASDATGSTNGYWNIKLQNIHVESTNPYAPFYYPVLRYTAGTNGLTSTGLSRARLYYGISTSSTDLNGSDYTHTKYVKNMGEFLIAYANRSVTKIQLTTDIVFPAGTSSINYQLASTEGNAARDIYTPTLRSNSPGDAVFIYVNIRGAARAVTIDGKKEGDKRYSMDFGAITLCTYDESLRNYDSSYYLRWYQTIQNINFFHGNYWGPIEIQDLSDSYEKECWQRFVDISDRGAQFLQAQSSVLYLAGEVDLQQRQYYQAVDSEGTPLRTDGTVSGYDSSWWRSNDIRNQTLGVWTTTIEDNANVTLTSLGGPALDLYEGGSGLTIGENVTLNATREGSDTSGDGYGAVFSLRGGSVRIGTGSVVNLTTTNTSSQNGILSMNAASASIDIAEGATMNLYRTGSTNSGNDNTSNPIYMNSSGSINVNGSLNIFGTGMASSSTNMIYSSGSVRFVIGKNGSLDVQSDSTSISQYLIRFGGGSTFQFSDAKRVNLQRTSTLSSATATNNGLIYYSGTLNVSVQNVYQWTLGNRNIGADGDIDGGSTYQYEPMSNMNIRFSSYTSSITSANSMYTTTLQNFYNNFSTRGQQRILFTQIPNPEVAIHNSPNDNPAQTDSHTISGYARPGTYLRVWEEALNGTNSAKTVDQANNVLTPVQDTNMDPETRANYTYQVPADSDGNWTIDLEDLGISETFTAENKIHVYGFYNLKSEEVEKDVLDKTAPQGTGLTYYSYVGEILPDASDFVDTTSITDTNPLPQTFTYDYADRPSAENALQAGTDDSGIEVPIYVYDNALNEGTIAAILVVYPESAGITVSSPLNIEYSTVRGLDDAALADYILQNVTLEAYKISDGVKETWTDYTDFDVTDLGNLTDRGNLAMNTPYPVTIMPKAATGLTGVSDVTTVYIINMNSTLTILFADESGQVLDNYTLTASKDPTSDIVTDIFVGDYLDLTSDTFAKVRAQKAALLAAGYASVTLPNGTDEGNFYIGDVDQEITYTAQGQLIIKSVPTSFAFGDLAFNAQPQRLDTPVISGNDLIVTDTRANKTAGWSLSAEVTTDLTNDVTNAVMKRALIYRNTDGTEHTLDTDTGAQIITSNSSGGTLNLSDGWRTSGTTPQTAPGLKLMADPVYMQAGSDGSKLGSYRGVITWTITTGTP